MLNSISKTASTILTNVDFFKESKDLLLSLRMPIHHNLLHHAMPHIVLFFNDLREHIRRVTRNFLGQGSFLGISTRKKDPVG